MTGQIVACRISELLAAISKYLAAVSEIVAVRLKVSASGLQTHYVSKMVTVVHDDP